MKPLDPEEVVVTVRLPGGFTKDVKRKDQEVKEATSEEGRAAQ